MILYTPPGSGLGLRIGLVASRPTHRVETICISDYAAKMRRRQIDRGNTIRDHALGGHGFVTKKTVRQSGQRNVAV